MTQEIRIEMRTAREKKEERKYKINQEEKEVGSPA